MRLLMSLASDVLLIEPFNSFEWVSTVLNGSYVFVPISVHYQPFAIAAGWVRHALKSHACYLVNSAKYAYVNSISLASVMHHNQARSQPAP